MPVYVNTDSCMIHAPIHLQHIERKNNPSYGWSPHLLVVKDTARSDARMKSHHQ
jgi:hypothetical protein